MVWKLSPYVSMSRHINLSCVMYQTWAVSRTNDFSPLLVCPACLRTNGLHLPLFLGSEILKFPVVYATYVSSTVTWASLGVSYKHTLLYNIKTNSIPTERESVSAYNIFTLFFAICWWSSRVCSDQNWTLEHDRHNHTMVYRNVRFTYTQ